MSMRLVLMLHALLGFGALALSVHLLLVCRAAARGRIAPIPTRRFAGLTCLMVGLTFLTGAIIYPAFRVHVRAEWMDANAPHLTGLFEIKEHWAALAIPLVIALWIQVGALLKRRAPPPVWRTMALLAGLLTLVIGYSALVGLWLVATRSI